MSSNKLSGELKEKYLTFKYRRDYCLQKQYLIAAFFHQIQIIEYYKSLPYEFESKEDQDDHQQIGWLILKDIFEEANIAFYNCISNDIAAALGYKKVLSGIPTEEHMSNVFCIHINIIKFLYQMDTSQEEIRDYFEKLTEAYAMNYGSESSLYLKLCLHIIGEAIIRYDSSYAKVLFNKYCEYFYEKLFDYLYVYDFLIIYASGCIEESDFQTVDHIIIKIDHMAKELLSDEDQNLIAVRCVWVKAKLHCFQGDFSLSEKLCNTLLETIAVSHPIFPEICSIMYMNNQKRGKKYSEWVNKGLAACEELSNKNMFTYYRLLSGKAALLYRKGAISSAIELARNVLEGMERLAGKESKIYIAALIDYFTLLDNEKAKTDFLADILIEIDNYNDPLLIAYTYNNLAALGFDLHGESTINAQILTPIAEKAVSASDETTDEWMRINSRINLLRLKVMRATSLTGKKDEINELFNFLELNRNRMDEKMSYSFEACYIIFYCNIGQSSKALTIVEKIEKELSSVVDKGEEYYNFEQMYINVLLINKRKSEAIERLNKNINRIITILHESSDLRDINNFVMFALSFVSQYGYKYACYNELSYKCALIYKYLNVKFDLGFERNNHNADLSRYISALELRKTNIDRLEHNEVEDIERQLKELRYNLDYTADKSNRLPNLYDIELPAEAVLFDTSLYIEFRHGDFINRGDFEENLLSVKIALFTVSHDKNGKQRVIRHFNVNINTMIDFFEDDNEDDYSELELRSLYKLFFKPAEAYITGSTTLYLSLDYYLSMIPFEALIDSSGAYLVDKYIIINVLVATDISPDFMVPLKNALLIGNPQYSITSKYSDEINNLNYAETEVNHIGRFIYSKKKYLRDEATKEAFFSNIESDIIHISSHGKFDKVDPEELQTPLIVSSVLLAGCIDFMHNEKKYGYGNGLLTAEDIINLRLDKTKLVVLSACESGTGYLDNTTVVKGVKWALGFTGAKASITSMYPVDDLGAAIFMVLFYDNLRNFPVAKSLNQAKIQMRSLSVKDIKASKLLNAAFGHEFSMYSDYEIPFEESFFWSAFDCYFYGGVVMTDVLEILNIKTEKVTNYLEREIKLNNLKINDFSEEKIKCALRAGIEAELVSVQEEANLRATVIKKEGGVSWRVKNVVINRKEILDTLLDLCEFIICINPLALIRVLKDIIHIMQVDLTNDEAYVFWNVYKAQKRGTVSDSNLFQIIADAIEQDDYDILTKREINKILEHLIKLQMIDQIDEKYIVTEKIVIKWQ